MLVYPKPTEQQQYESDAFVALQVATQYLHGSLDAPSAEARLHGCHEAGKFMTGEVYLEEASKSDAEAAKGNISQAEAAYRKSLFSATDRLNPASACQSRALLRLSQMAVIVPVIQDKRMPLHDEATTAYGDTLNAYKTIIRAYRSDTSYERTKVRGQIIGVLGELSVLLLAQRYAIRHHITDCWFPLQSTARGEYAGYTDQGKNKSWDIEINTAGEDGQPAPTYKLQVKAGHQLQKDKPYSKRIKMVYVSRDLQLGRTPQPKLAMKILKECAVEGIAEARDSRTISHNLDARTEKLLNIID